MIKKAFIGVGIAAVILLTSGAAMAETISDDTNDVFHWHWNENLASYGWAQATSDKPNIDITEISADASGGQLTITLRVRGSIEDDEDVWYWAWYNTTEATYYLSYNNGNGSLFGVGTNYTQFMQANATASGDTITGTIDLIGSGARVKFWAWAATGYNMGGNSGEYWQDWAPQDYAPELDTDGGDNGGGGDGGDGGIPGFGLLLAVGALALGAVTLATKRR